MRTNASPVTNIFGTENSVIRAWISGRGLEIHGAAIRRSIAELGRIAIIGTRSTTGLRSALVVSWAFIADPITHLGEIA
jgi:hypothetical protein